MELRQTRTMTKAGNEQFGELVSRHTVQLSSISREIDIFTSTCMEQGISLSDIDDAHDKVKGLADTYEKTAQDYDSLLKGYRTLESDNEKVSLQENLELVRLTVTDFFNHLNSMRPKIGVDTGMLYKSNGSCGSRGSSKLTAALIEHTVKVEEARTRLKYAEEEADLLKQEAALKASRTMLTVRKELEAAEHGLDAVRKVIDFSSSESSRAYSHRSHVTARQDNFLTKRYVSENAKISEPPPNEVIHESALPSLMVNKPTTLTPTKVDNSLNPCATSFLPQSKQNDAAELAKAVVKNQLIPQRLSKFSGEPSRYLTWKNTFRSVMIDISANTLEQLDLLLNHLDPTCKIQCDNIRSANARDPVKALREIWERLDMEYGSAEAIEQAIKLRINNFPNLTDSDHKRYFDLYDLAAEVESLKGDTLFGSAFAYFDSSRGINEFVLKLPRRFREKWASLYDKYKINNKVNVPFSVFTKFLRDLSRLRNDPSLMFDNLRVSPSRPVQHPCAGRNRLQGASGFVQGTRVNVHRTSVTTSEDEHLPQDTNSSERCPIHGDNSNHTLKDCEKFRKKPYKERIDFIFKRGYCLKCCGSKRHRKKNCTATVKCERCKSSEHVTVLHVDEGAARVQEGEPPKVSTLCTDICGVPSGTSKSCSKIVLVNVFPEGEQFRERKVYCLIDDQSNRSLASSSFFDMFGESGRESEFILSTCAGSSTISGRIATGYTVRSLDDSCTLKLPNLIECNEIPNNLDEIPSKAVACSHPHLRDISENIPELHEGVNVEILIGRDLISAHHVLEQRVGGDGQPFGQRLPLGWVIIGDVCLGKVHQPETISVSKTFILADGRASHLSPCDSEFSVKESYSSIFKRQPDDEKIGLSIEDKTFLTIMESGFRRTTDGLWEAPLPFRDSRQPLPDNRLMALRRANAFDTNLKANPAKQRQVLEFMDELLANKHAEVAPELPALERWYLPMFAVYHPKKRDSVRVVFDSSAKFRDVSLNSVLLQGPDLCNSLMGVLLRFRRERVAITMDIEKMFYNFKVPEDHRRFLRFLWHQENNINLPLVDFQMTVHVFGNSASPAVATYGLRKAVGNSEADIQDIICNNFYVDDGLLSVQTDEQAIDLVLRTKQALQEGGNIRLHKFASNSRKVLDSFCQSDLAKSLKDLDLGIASLPMQRSLGLLWDTETDEFTFKVTPAEKAYTRRGLLSIINSVYDPLGFAQPVLVRGKLLLREMRAITSDADWDDPLPDSLYEKWFSWVNSLSHLEQLRVPRMCGSISFGGAVGRRILVYSDASKDIIAAVAYLKLDSGESTSTRFLLGKAKVAPPNGHTIPRLELCAAVLATEIAETISDQLNVSRNEFQFFSDSQVVLGYIANENRRFFVYVGNRVGRIRSFSKPSQWNFVQSECNPADVATRPVEAEKLQFTSWLRGPENSTNEVSPMCIQSFDLVDPDQDVELRPEVSCAKTKCIDATRKTVKSNCTNLSETTEVFSERFSHISKWSRLVRVVARIKRWAIFSRKDGTDTPHYNDSKFMEKCEHAIIAGIQRDSYSAEFQCIRDNKDLSKSSSIRPLSPIIDAGGVLHVGGRLNKVNDDVIDAKLRNPIILPKNHHVTYLIVRHFHEKVSHQGRHFTEGAVRSGGFWIVSCKKMVSSVISGCVMCRKLRGPFGWQHMADLPEDRCKPSPAFSYVGVDTFGPYLVKFRRTRGGIASQKRWALLFTCLVTRAIHIEVIEELTSSTFINALRRLIAIRGPILQFRSDRGTNFVGAIEDLSIDASFIESEAMTDFLSNTRTKWIFNPPHSPHMGGAWERLIGIAKGILSAMLLQHRQKDLTHEVLTTFLAEVCAIVNNRPLTCVSNDPESPMLLTPSMLLTMKSTSEINPFPPFSSKDALRSTWKQVQTLAEEFWRRWRSEYLHGLQIRRKWQNETTNLKRGDLVLVKDSESARNEWPTGIIERTFPSHDNIVRKVEVTIMKNGKRSLYVRPVTELVTVLEA